MIDNACGKLQLACLALWQRHENLQTCVAKSSAELINSLQMVENINQMQQDIVMLDVGGHVHHLSKQSVTRHRDSFFGGLFSDMFNPGECVDPEFIDRDGELFHTIASYLRHGKWFCNLHCKEHVKNECAFYCLPPPTLPHFVWLSRKSQPWMIHFTPDNGATQCEGLSLSLRFKTPIVFAVSSATSLYFVHELEVFECDYFDTRWNWHVIKGPASFDLEALGATSNALYAIAWGGDIYKMQLDGNWTWDLLIKRTKWNGHSISISNDAPVVVNERGVFTYNDYTQLWNDVCTAPPDRHGFCHWCVVTRCWVYACVKTRIWKCSVNGTVWELTTCEFNSQYRVTHACESHGALHIFTFGEHWRCDIDADGSLPNLVMVQQFKDLWCIGVRDD